MLFSRKNYKFNTLGISLEQLLIGLLIICLINITIIEFYNIIFKKFLIIKNKLVLLHKKNIATFWLNQNLTMAGYKGFASNLSLPEYTSIALNDPIMALPFSIPRAPIAVCKASVNYNNCKSFVNKKIFKKIINQTIKPNTDLLLAYDIPVKITKLSTNMLENNSPLTINIHSIDEFNLGDYMIIADQQYIQRFIISNIIGKQLLHAEPYNYTQNFIKPFHQNAEICKLKHLAFYVAKNQGIQTNLYSLYMDDFSANTTHAIAIIDDVEDLSIKIPNIISTTNPIFSSSQNPSDPTNNQSIQLADAADFGWLYNQPYIIINLLLKNPPKNDWFSVGIAIRNHG